MAAQEFHAHGFEEQYYYNSKKFGEVDLVIEKDGHVFPVEIKSGKDYVRHRAMNNIMTHPEFTIPKAIVLYNDNLSVEDSIIDTPIYMIMFIHKEKIKNFVFNLDLSCL